MNKLRNGSLLLIILLFLSACSFGSSNQAAEQASVALESYDPSGATAVPQESANVAPTSGNSSANADGTSTQSQAASQVVAAPAAASDSQSLLLASQGNYNGEIKPAETVVIVAEVAGKVLELPLQEGDHIMAGQPLARIESNILEGQQAQAVAGLKAAQAQLDQVLSEADSDTVEAIQAAVNAAAVAYQETQNGASAEDLQIAEAQVRQAQAAVRAAQAAYNEIKGNPRASMMPQSVQLEQATLALEAVRAQYQKVLDGAPVEAIAGAYANLVQSRSQLANLQEGAKPEQIRAVEAQVEAAEAALYLATLQIAKATVTAPMDGIVMRKYVSVGSMAAPGAPLVELMSTDVHITIPVEENRMATLAVGQPAMIQVNAYPGTLFEGEIIRIAPQLNAATRTVEVTIRPTNDVDKLLVPGMFATVDLVN